jgi:hypothetical protein
MQIPKCEWKRSKAGVEVIVSNPRYSAATRAANWQGKVPGQKDQLGSLNQTFGGIVFALIPPIGRLDSEH